MNKMVYHFGKKGYFAWSLQNVEGTQETAFDCGVPIESEPKLAAKIETKYPKEYRKTDAERTSFIRTAISAEGDIEFSAYPGSGLEHAIYGVMGAQSSAAHGTSVLAYDNTFTVGTDLPIFSAAIGRDELNMETFKDLRMGKLDLKFDPGSDVKATVSLSGKPTGIGSSDITPSYGTERQFTFDDIGVTLGGSANCDIKNVSLSIDRGLKSLRTACASAGKGDNMFYATTTAVEGSFTMLFQNYDEYEYYLGADGATTYSFDADEDSATRTLVITATGGLIDDTPTPDVYNQMVITIPKIYYESSVISMPFDDRMEVEFNFVALYDSTADPGEETIGIVVTSLMNGVTSPA